jgi:hypothetical protein
MVGLLTLWLPRGLVSQAQASCGDYLAHPVTTPNTTSSTMAISGEAVPGHVQEGPLAWSLAGSLAGSLERRPAGGDRWPVSPCQGGRCERAPVPPMPPVPVRIGGTERQFVDERALRDAETDSFSLLLAIEDSGPVLPGFPYRIRRPPEV